MKNFTQLILYGRQSTDCLSYLYYHDLDKINVAGKSGLILIFALTSNDKCVTIQLKEMI